MAIAQKSPDKLAVQDEGMKGSMPFSSSTSSFSGKGNLSRFKGKKKGGGLNSMPSPVSDAPPSTSSSILQ